MENMHYDEYDLTVIKNGGLLHNDDDSVFFARELEAVKKKTYDQKTANLNAARLFPVATDTDPGAETITYQSYGQVGMAEIISNYAKDLPRADVQGEEHTVKVYSIGNAYGYNVQEIRAARMAGKPLVQRKAAAARRAHDEKLNKLAFKGDAAYGIVGILDNPNISIYTPDADGTDNATAFVKKTPAQILRDLNKFVSSIVTLTNGVEVPDTLVLPIEQYTYIANTPYSEVVSDSILSVFIKNNPYIKSVEQAAELKGAGTGGKDVALCYVNDNDHLTLEVPMGFTQYTVQQKGLEYIVPCESRVAGVIVYYPLSVCKMVGI